jgi:PAS domain S-box-containing protein
MPGTKKETELRRQIDSLQQRVVELEQTVLEYKKSAQERNKIEEALRESEDKFKYVFDNSVVGKSFTMPTGEVRVNKSFCDMLGFSPEELESKSWQDITHPDDVESSQKEIDALLSGEKTAAHFNKRFLKKDGSILWSDVSSSLRRDAEDKPLYFMTTLVDITERKQMEEQLLLLKYSIDISFDGVYWIDPDGRFVYVNNTGCRSLGYDLHELLHMRVTDVNLRVTPERWAEVWRTIRNNKVFTAESVHRRKDGSEYPVEIISTYVKFGEQEYCNGFARDITERKRVEEALQQSEKKFRLLTENSVIGIYIIQDGKMAYVNSSFAKTFGYSSDEINDKLSPEDLIHPDDIQIVMRKLQERQEGIVEKSSNIFKAIKKDKSLIYIEVYGMIFDYQGRPAVMGTLLDVTERKSAEVEHEKIEEQFRMALKMEAVGRLAGGLAHDFNNMLSIILGYGEHLIEQLYDRNLLQEEAKEIVKASQRSASLIRQLLAYSRRQTLQPKVLVLNTVIRNMDKMVHQLLGEDTKLELQLSRDLAYVMADPGQIEQVILNLVVNAHDAMPQGGTLIIKTENVELDDAYARDHTNVMPGPYVMLAMTDTGFGMDKETLAHIFDPFFTTKEKGKGTGLGLPMVYGIVKQSGGHIWVDSEPGNGTTFKIYLPQTQDEPWIEEDKPKDKRKGNGEYILLVEDEESIRTLLKTNLLNLDYKVSSAANGSEALQLVEKKTFKPDLVITDVVMPGMSGSELVKHLYRTHPGIKVLFMSGYADDAVISHGVLDPGTFFIQKPFDISELAAKVWDVLHGKGTVKRSVKKILMIDDDVQVRDLVRWFCTKGGHDFTGVDSSAGAIEVLAGQAVDVLLIDMNIPGTDGKRVLEEIRAAGHTMPAIVLSGDLYSIDMNALRPLGVVNALEKSGDAQPLLQMLKQINTGKET